MKEIPLITPLQKFYQYEKEKANQTFLRQAINDQWIHYSWKETGEIIRTMAAAIQAQNYPKGTKIAILSANCAHWIMADLAIMMTGCISVPLYPTITADIIDYCLEHSESKLCFVGKLDKWHEQKQGIPKNVTCVSFPDYPQEDCIDWNAFTKKVKPLKQNYIPDLDDICTIIYTSGTTGKPKGVVHNFESIAYAPTWLLKELEYIIENDRFFSFLQLAHIAERMLVEMGALYCGASISFAESIEKVPQNLKDTQPTVFLAVPLIWTRMQNSILARLPQERLDMLLKIPFLSDLIKKKVKENAGLSQCKYIISGAAPIPVSLIEWYEKLDITICEAYGMSENCAFSHGNRLEFRKVGTVGQPMPNTQVKISDVGEILVKNKCTMQGYYKDEAKTKETITEDGYLRTGDKGEIDVDGFLKITGRIKEIFKTDKGKYVAPAPIELELSKSPYIAQVCVVGANMKQPIALVNYTNENGADNPTIEADLITTMSEVNSKLSSHEKVAKIIIMKEDWTVENGLMTPTLKVKRSELEQKVADKVATWTQDRDTRIIWE